MIHPSKLNRKIVISNLIDYYINILHTLPIEHIKDENYCFSNNNNLYNVYSWLYALREYSKLFDNSKLIEEGFYDSNNINEIIRKIHPNVEFNYDVPPICFCDSESILSFDIEEYKRYETAQAQSKNDYGISLAYRLRDGDLSESELTAEELRLARSNM